MSEIPIEEQFVLRLPLDIAEQVRKEEKPSLKFIFRNDREASITYKDTHFDATLVDLPCILETYKTSDSKQFCKTADVCKMLVTGKAKKQHPNGLTPPLQQVRRRFRTRSTKANAVQEIETIVAKLIEADSRALKVEHEIVESDNDSDHSAFAHEVELGLFDELSVSEEEEEVNPELESLQREIKDLEEKINIKKQQIENAPNIIISNRFKEALNVLEADLEQKLKRVHE